MRIERGGEPLAAQSNTQPGVIGFAFLFDIAVPGAPRRGFALMDQGPCADWKETQRRALSKTVQRRQFSQMRARSPALHRARGGKPRGRPPPPPPRRGPPPQPRPAQKQIERKAKIVRK